MRRRISQFGKIHLKEQNQNDQNKKKTKLKLAEKKEQLMLEELRSRLIRNNPELERQLGKCHSIVEQLSSRMDLLLSSRRKDRNSKELDEFETFLNEQEEILFSRNGENNLKPLFKGLPSGKYSTAYSSDEDFEDGASDEGSAKHVRIFPSFAMKNKFRSI